MQISDLNNGACGEADIDDTPANPELSSVVQNSSSAVVESCYHALRHCGCFENRHPDLKCSVPNRLCLCNRHILGVILLGSAVLLDHYHGDAARKDWFKIS